VIFNYMSFAQARDFYNNTRDKAHFAFLNEFVQQRRAVADPTLQPSGRYFARAHPRQGPPPTK
jgi:hypothetical protein